MNNFFYDSSDFAIFKKAYKATRNEPVVINILSSDSSLKGSEDPKRPVKTERKNMSGRYQPNSPFGRFFGPRQPDTSPIDMKDFSSWKNKNYRKIEENLDKSRDENKPKFSLADYLKNRNKEKYQSSDATVISTQKPITQLSSSEPNYKKFFLDRYMNNIEEQAKVKTEFEQNDDLLEPLGEQTQRVVADSSQDEDFGYTTKFDVEDVVFDNNSVGDNFKLEKDELDNIKKRLDAIEQRSQEASKPQPKPRAVYTIDEDEEEEPEIEPEIEPEEEPENEPEQEPAKERVEAPAKVRTVVDEQFEPETEEEENEPEEEPEPVVRQPRPRYAQTDTYYSPVYVEQKASDEDYKRQAEMQAKLDELIEQNSRADERIEQSIRNANLEKKRVAEEYEIKIKELEESYKKHIEEIKQQSYLEKLEREAKLDQVQSKISMRERELSEREKASLTMLNSSALLKQELKSNLDISNLEMDKKLLEITSENKDIDLDIKKLSEVETENLESSETKKKQTRTTSKKTSTKTAASGKAGGKAGLNVDVGSAPKKKRKKRRKIDSDIVTNYNFD